MQYPRWFPYPSCWLRAIVLDIATFFASMGAMLVFIGIAPIVGIAGSNLDAIEEGASHPVLMVAFVIVCVIAPIFVLGFFDRMLWNRAGANESLLPRRRNWIEGIFAYASVVLVALLVAFFFAIFVCDSYYKCRHPDTRGAMLVMFTIGLAYCFQGRFLVLQWWGNRQKQRNKRVNRSTLPRSKRAARSIEDSDRDLNELRWQERQRQERERVSRSSPPPAAPPPSSSIDDELERLRRDMEDKNK